MPDLAETLTPSWASPRNGPPPAGAIGVFDSGLGGLSVLRALSEALPGERFVYVADSKHAPYGAQSDDFIAARSLAISGWLAENGAKMLVVACNTATAHAIEILRSKLAIPVVGVEPGVKPAAMATKTGVVGVLATEATLRSDRFLALLARQENRARFVTQAGHGLVEAVERGDTDSPVVMALLESYLRPMIDANADRLVLGCTHYPFLAPSIRSIAGDALAIVDTSAAVARQAQKLLFDAALDTDLLASSIAWEREAAKPRQMLSAMDDGWVFFPTRLSPTTEAWFFSNGLSYENSRIASQMQTGRWMARLSLIE